MKYFYITTTLPYVNAEPHLGFALEIVKADVIARWHRAQGEEVFFNTGVDEHGLKIYRKAEELGMKPQDYCDQMAAKFQALKEALNLSYDSFIRTSDERHLKAAQEFWRRCQAAGDIYKKNYQIKYCVGCELEKNDSDLVHGRCPTHPDLEPELLDEENYFFRFSKYQQPLLKFYNEQPDFVLPAGKFKEIKNFVASGLSDFSVSRLISKLPWGVPVPDDDSQVMYVWFDALINYISCLDWPDGKNFAAFWPGVQICGKDNLRQQTAMWQAMLMSAGLANSKRVLVNGFITANGQKMSKSSGNVVDPLALTADYGTDAVRYYLLAEMNPFEDSDFSQEKFAGRYQADLANGLGNLAARLATLAQKNNLTIEPGAPDKKLTAAFAAKMEAFLFNEALALLWSVLRAADEKLSRSQPWKMTEAQQIKDCLTPLVNDLRQTAVLVAPLLPETAAKISAQFADGKISKGQALFPRVA